MPLNKNTILRGERKDTKLDGKWNFQKTEERGKKIKKRTVSWQNSFIVWLKK